MFNIFGVKRRMPTSATKKSGIIDETTDSLFTDYVHYD